jgi:Carboxypeptidase regulatory-like domain
MKRTLAISLSSLLLMVNLFGLGAPGAAHAQGLIELRGTVIDETNAYIAAAPLALDDGQGKKYTAVADDHGRYRFTVKPGTYTLTVEVEGFGKFSEQVDLTTKPAGPYDVKLKVGLAEQVEVKDNSAAISTEPDKNLSAITLTEKDLEALPDDPDELLQTLKQMAGAAGGGDDASVYVGGFRERGQLPPKEAILRISINQNPYSAEYSEPGASRIEIITKPGSDTFHGGANFTFNDEKLNARDAFATFRSPFQDRRYGGYFSGPIIRNRWGFFFDLQRVETDGNGFVNAVVLDPITFLPTPFAVTVLTPSRNLNFSIRSDYLATKQHTIGVQFRHSQSESSRSGGGFTLPERGSSSSSSENNLRLSFTTIASEHAVNEMRIQLSHRDNMSRALSDAVAINVLDAFNGGGAQVFTDNSSKNLDFTDNVTYTRKSHTFKMGFRAEAVQPNNLGQSNFGGTFIFGQDFERNAQGGIILGADGAATPISPIDLYSRVVRGVPGYHPSQFSISRGDPFIGFSQWEYGWFAQDDWKVSKRFFLSYGLRHEFQTHLQDKLNFAPRFSIAWSADKAGKSTVRAGGGIFYTYLDSSVIAESIRLDGGHQQQFVIQQPNFFETIPQNLDNGTTQRLPTTRTIAPGLNDPYSMIASVNYERQLPLKMLGSVGYTFTRGVHLLRTRNINAPTGFDKGVPIVPFPSEGPLLEYESNGLMTRHQMSVNVRTGFSQKLTLFFFYNLASMHNNTDGANSNPANPYDLSTEWGRAGGDFRHTFYVYGQIIAPWAVRFTPFITARSGAPFNITTGRDNNRDNQFSDRPSFANPADPGAIVTSFGTFNPDPLPGEQIIPRNFGQGPGFVTVNMGVSRTFGFGPSPNNMRAATATSNGQAGQDGQANPQAQNQRGNRGGGAGNPNRGGGGGGGFGGGGGPQMVTRGGGGGGNAMMMGGGSDARHRYNLTVGINALDIFNHANLGPYNQVLTSSFFGRANSTVGSRGGFGGGGSRRVDLSLRFSF